MITTWPAPAKINLFLYINSRRSDGYHNLQTLFQLLDYSDILTIEVNDSNKISLITPIAGVTYEKNLVVRAAHLLRTYAITKGLLAKKNVGAKIFINKRIFIGGGLGGGSSNAATVLIALNYLWGIGLNLSELATLGIKLGADLPLFIHGFTAFAEGIGNKLTPINLVEKWYLVIYPKIKISTSIIFNDPLLIYNRPRKKLSQLLKQQFYNDCEPVVKNRFFKVEQLIYWLLKYAPSRLTGTGSCVFAEFDNKADASKILHLIPTSLEGFVAKGVDISPLHWKLLSKKIL